MSDRWEIMSYSDRIFIFGHGKKRETLEKAFFSPDFFSCCEREISHGRSKGEKEGGSGFRCHHRLRKRSAFFGGYARRRRMHGLSLGKMRRRMCVFTFLEKRMQGGKRLTGERGKKEGSNGEGRKEEGRPDTRNRMAKIKFNNNT